MRRRIKLVGFLFLGGIMFSFSTQYVNTLHITITDLRNSDGVVLLYLYNQEGSIPDREHVNYYKKTVLPISNATATFSFKNIPSGHYAVTMIHDENSNGTIDVGFLLPKEGVGTSNFDSLSFFNRPNFEKAQFTVEKETYIEVKALYF
jgi:uncharacterized protein (DUF2141 family)